MFVENIAFFEGKFREGSKWTNIPKFLPFHYTGLHYLVLTTQYEYDNNNKK